MLNQWFYAHPTWEVATVVCLFLMILPLLGLSLLQRWKPSHHREHDTAMVGLSYALCGSLYAVMLAFVAVGAYETMDKTALIASEEANSLGGIAFDTAGLPAELAFRIRQDVDEYINTVVKKEWPSQRAYRMEPANYDEGWAQLRKLSLDLAGFEPTTPGQATVKAEVEHVINDLFASRRTRLLAAKQHLPDAVWQMLIFGLGLVALYVWLFGTQSHAIHMACTALTMLSIGLAFTLVIALDYPFRGDVSVDSESYTGVQELTHELYHFHPEGTPAAEHTGPPPTER